MRYFSMFKLGYLMESNQLQQQQPKRSTNWLKPVVGAGAAAGLAYMGDRYLNNGAGANWLKQQFNDNSQPVKPKAVPMPNVDPATMNTSSPDYQQIGQVLSGTNQAIGALGHGAAEDGGRALASGQFGQAAGATIQLAPTALRQYNQGLNLPKFTGSTKLPGLSASAKQVGDVVKPAGKLIPGIGGIFGALNDDIAERGFANVNLGEPANRTLGGVAGAVTSLHPVGLVGHILGQAGLGAYNWHTGRLAETNSHAGDVGDYALTLMRALKEQPDQALPYARGFLQMPVVRNMIDNPAERHPASNQLLQRLMTATQQLEQR